MMNTTHKLVVTLLVISLIMSVIAVVLNVAILNMDLSPESVTQVSSQRTSSDNGRIGLVVESAPGEESAANG